jgi:hypothetical protein
MGGGSGRVVGHYGRPARSLPCAIALDARLDPLVARKPCRIPEASKESAR